MNATLHLDSQHHVGNVDRRIFGGFLEHLGRAVYEGVYDPGNPLSDADGFRRDVIDVLKPLAMPIMRYPGGNFVSAYDWKDGVGLKQNRPKRPDYAWQSIESNQFGTDEFMKWCKQIDTAPMMAVNLGTAGATEAGQLLEYCNMKTGTYWADQRKKNGHADPYGAKLWCLGNEMDGPWQAGHVPAEVYAQRALAASQLMKGLDNSIETVACGSSARGMNTYLEYDRTVLEYCWNSVDYISAHRYSNNNRNDTPWYLAEGVEITRVIEDYAGLIGYVRGMKKNDKNVYVSFDEWNVWYKAHGPDHCNGKWAEAPHLLEEVYNLEDALVCAQYLSAFIRRADVVKVACIAQIANVIAPILTRKEGVLVQSIYYPFLMFSKYANGVSLTPVVKSPMYKAGERGETPVLDTAATLDETGNAAVFLTNRSSTDAISVDVHISDRKPLKVSYSQVLAGTDAKAANSWENPNAVKPAAASCSIVDERFVRVNVPALGFATVQFSTTQR
jgi:alpha-N-arabinofuranosidase